MSFVPTQSWFAEQEVLLECAPIGKFARVVHEFANKKYLPAAFVWWAMFSLIPGFWLLYRLGILAGTVAANRTGFLAAIVLLPFLVVFGKLLLKPTHVSVSAQGVANCWRRTITIRGKVLPWTEIHQISVVQPEHTSRVQSRLLRFWGPQRHIDLKVDEVTELAMLPSLYNAILNNAPNVPRDPEVQSILGSDNANASYTELWLKALTAPPERSRLTPLSAGTQLQDGEYIVQDRIGAGGQGVAYTATRRDGDHGGTVVLKEYVLPVGVSHGTKVESLEKFQREARILGAIDHPNIVKLIDFFFEDHRGYMVLEYVRGTSLSGLVRGGGALDVATVVRLAEQMATILEHLHAQNPPVVHRDFTPDNLILTNDSVLKLIDFNVAQQKANSATATVVGKHSYIAPDQFRGQVTPQCDIYSMGATMFFLLTGAEPKPISVSHPKLKRPELDDAIDDFVARCTAVDTTARFATMSDLKQAQSRMACSPTT